jgi:predicted molibdopterin-dependent oxidoreductase YjgC
MSPPANEVTITIDGTSCRVAAGTSVAAAILNNEQSRSRSPVSTWRIRTSVGGEPRAPLCGMGICFECRATVDGRPHERTCQLSVRDGMEVRTDD